MAKTIKSPTKDVLQVIRQNVSETRKDIADWRNAKRMAQLAQNPRWDKLQQIYNLTASDAVLGAQIDNRVDVVKFSQSEIVNTLGNVNEGLTKELKKMPFIYDIIAAISESTIYEYSVSEFRIDSKTGLKRAKNIKRENIDPVFGRFYPRANDDKFVEYRDLKEYNRFILEFDSETLGLLDRCVSSALFKRFAMSCWSEYDEICGIPPRILKTQTSDPEMLARGKEMMREFGAASWALIDSTEELSFAQSVQHNGDVYNNLKDACNQEMSIAISRAQIGQDTKNGNRSKEEVSIQMLDRAIQSDKIMVEMHMNTTVIPALVSIGWLPANIGEFRFATTEDTDRLWDVVRYLSPYKEIDDDFILATFGVPTKPKRYDASASLIAKLTGGDPDFFA
jgi:hypothetical protein